MKILRLEHDGKGVYSSGVLYRINMPNSMYDNRTPGPGKDLGLLKAAGFKDALSVWDSSQIFSRLKKILDCNELDILFGFLNEYQMLAWFNAADLGALINEGVKVLEYDVPDASVIIGEKQVVFDKNVARQSAELTVRYRQYTIPTWIEEGSPIV